MRSRICEETRDKTENMTDLWRGAGNADAGMVKT